MSYNPPIGSIYHLYTTYILPSRGLYNPYHLLPEPEKSIEISGCFGFLSVPVGFSSQEEEYDGHLISLDSLPTGGEE